MRKELKKVKKIVIKLGSNILAKNGGVDSRYIHRFAKQIASIKKEKKLDVVVVTSGAVALGAEGICAEFAGLKGGRPLRIQERPLRIEEKQAAAACGQSKLMHIYDRAFAKYGFSCAQILVTKEDLLDKTRKANIKNTIDVLLKCGIVPVVNENDTVSVDEIKIGDNDTLSAYITDFVGAKLLVILTSVDGLIDYETGDVVSEVLKIDKKIECLIRPEKTGMGTGGMASKINAAKIVNKFGEYFVIANGRTKNVIKKILDGKEIGTIFKMGVK